MALTSFVLQYLQCLAPGDAGMRRPGSAQSHVVLPVEEIGFLLSAI